MKNTRLLDESLTILEALKVMNSIKEGPLVFFVVDKDGKLKGTLTDGDVRRALVANHKISEKIARISNSNYNFIRYPDSNLVEHLREQKEKKMRLVPLLDKDNHIVEVIDLTKHRTKLPIDAVLMAGGKGERLRPLTEKTPKPLLPVGDKAIIDHNISRLLKFGVEHINVTVNYLGEQIEKHFLEPIDGIQIECVHEPKFLGTIGSIQYVKKFYNDVVLVMNSDLFTNIDYEDFYLHFIRHDADMSAAAVPYTISVPYGIFDLDGRNIKNILEKPVYNYFANAGIYLIKKHALQQIPEGVFFNATDLMEKLIAQGRKVIRFPITGFWLDIGSKVEYEKAQELVKHINE